jgi:hypothetical protein
VFDLSLNLLNWHELIEGYSHPPLMNAR